MYSRTLRTEIDNFVSCQVRTYVFSFILSRNSRDHFASCRDMTPPAPVNCNSYLSLDNTPQPLFFFNFIRCCTYIVHGHLLNRGGQIYPTNLNRAKSRGASSVTIDTEVTLICVSGINGALKWMQLLSTFSIQYFSGKHWSLSLLRVNRSH